MNYALVPFHSNDTMKVLIFSMMMPPEGFESEPIGDVPNIPEGMREGSSCDETLEVYSEAEERGGPWITLQEGDLQKGDIHPDQLRNSGGL